MGKFIDMTGWVMSEHGVPDSLLTVIRQGESIRYNNGYPKIIWECTCSCGNPNIVKAQGYHLRNGDIKSCGCLAADRAINIGHQNKRYNEYNLDGTYGVGYTSKNEEFYFDLEDYNKIKEFCWYYDSCGYVRSYTKRHDGGKRETVALHNLVMQPIPKGMIVDHICHPENANEHKVDNCKNNLRYVTQSQNAINQVPLRSNNSSGHKGVSWNKRGCWRAKITINQRDYVKYFSSSQYQEACDWYDKMADKLHGEYKYRNNNIEKEEDKE